MVLLLPRRKTSGIDVADVFSTDLYTGNGSTQSITNGIDLSGEGGLVWLKSRSYSGSENELMDSNRGANNRLFSNRTDAQDIYSPLSSFNSDGFSLRSSGWGNSSGHSLVGWTFRKSPSFFDVVTYTGNGVAGRTISHDLGEVPGMIIIKCTTVSGSNWIVYHRSQNATPQNYYLQLEATNAAALGSGFWNNTAPTDTNFTLGSWGNVNQSGATFVAYLFAHDDSDNGIIQCGSYTGNGSATGPVIDLGWEPQWLMIKRTSGGTGFWYVFDNQRNTTNPRNSALFPNSSSSETTSTGYNVDFLATGFQLKTSQAEQNNSGNSYAYIAIRKEGA